MENTDNTEKNINASPEKPVESTDSTTTNVDSQIPPDWQEIVQSGEGRVVRFALPIIGSLDFPRTPQRNKEFHRFCDILESPGIDVPLLIAERQEDILPLLSMYMQATEQQGAKISFLSVSPTHFDWEDDTDSPNSLTKRMSVSSQIIEKGLVSGVIPVYCDLSVYADLGVFDKFGCHFLKEDMPAILCVKPQELKTIHEAVEMDRQISGGIENPNTPYEPQGFARTRELVISPLTRAEKHVYFSYHIQCLTADNDLICSTEVCSYIINQMLNRYSHQDVFFQVFDVMNQAIVEAKKNQRSYISKGTISKILRKHTPIHNRTKAMMDLDERLKQKIYGQDQAIETCYDAILADLDDEYRTKPTVLGFFGPSGVGKTALAEEISLALTGKKVSAINMSEYADAFKTSILTGSSKGYVDSEEDGLLAKIVKENPRAVILLDEFEKAHPEVQKMFLGVFDKGSLYDNHSGQIDMSQTTIILTSNAGIRSNTSLGFGAAPTKQYVADKSLIQDEFPPELLGRLDAKVLFNPLSHEALGKVVDKFMRQLKPRFDKLGVSVSLLPEAKEELIEKAQDPSSGARPILSMIRQKIKTPIEIGVLKKRIKRGSHVIIQHVDKKEMSITSKRNPTKIIPMQNTNS